MKKILILSLMICSSFSLIANQPEEEDPIVKELLSLDWLSPGTHKLPISHSSLSVPAGHLVVIGDDARKLSQLTGNGFIDSLEAVTMNDSGSQAVYFCYHDEGYVSIDDWKEVDPMKMIKSISESTEKANPEKRKKGINELHVIGWIQEPTLDRNTNTVYWSIELQEGDEQNHTFNSIALRLGRNGFERIVWVGSAPDYEAFGGELDVMLRAHSFEPGHRYCDYTTGDKVATYGVATLVAATVGAKIAKAGGFAGLLILLKKFGGFIVAGAAALFCKKCKSSKNKGQ